MSITEVEVVRSNVELAGPRAAEPCVLIVGEEPTTSAPTLTLSRALDRLGTTVRFVDANQMSRGEWIRQLRSATAIVRVSYAKVDVYLLSQLATAVAMDVPIVRWWVGTDVLNAISREAIRRNVARVDWIVSTNVAVAPHPVDEL